ncbi:MAG: thiolase family protein [Deltaproteobacteria bacterium]|nr:thiolase family protein [Deltaproteobacteria bacterium]
MKEVVIVSAVRSPMGRAHKGNFAFTRIDDLAAEVIQGCLKRAPGLDPNEIEELLFGCAMPEGEQGMNLGRNVGFLAGLPISVPAATLNHFCCSSLATIMAAAQAIMANQGDIYLSAGAESMTHVPMGGYNPSLNPRLLKNEMPQAYISMGITAENLVDKYKISRAEQDEFAAKSHQKAVKAMRDGLFKDEIIPITAYSKTGETKMVDTDEGPRADSTIEKLATLKPVFKQGGTVTAGNSSPLTDGASATLVMSLDKAKELGLKPLAKIISMAVAGCDPAIMGIGPVPAIKKALKRANLKLDQIDIFELNEAFAAQSLAVIKELNLNQDKINPKGGAIALGHPLGGTGGRIMATLVHDLRQFNKKYGLESMCVGGGQGAAMIIETSY